MPYNHKWNVLSVSLNKTLPSFLSDSNLNLVGQNVAQQKWGIAHPLNGPASICYITKFE